MLANTNTWNAYNDWDGTSKYTNPPGAILSFERPNPAASPVGRGLNHLTRAELWLLDWMKQSGYRVDVYSDRDFHLGIPGLSGYKALVLNTHPEYWTPEMLDHLEAYLQGGGCVLYLGGNGVYEKVSFNASGSALILLEGNPATNRARCYSRNQTPPRPERALLGVAYRLDNYMTFAPFRVLEASHRFFAGTGLADGDEIGQQGLNGGASGWEMDTSIAGTAPDGVIVTLTSAADDRGAPPANLELLARGTNPGYGADMTVYETGAGGFVFSAGSLSFGGSLVQDSRLQTILRNVLNESLAR
jgi:hypothetical protein